MLRRRSEADELANARRAWRNSIWQQAQACSSGDATGCFSASVKRYANFAAFSYDFAKRLKGQRAQDNIIETIDALANVNDGDPEVFVPIDVETRLRAAPGEGGASPTAETCVSAMKDYAAAYRGVLVELRVQNGTREQLEAIGVREPGHFMTASMYPEMAYIFPGWNAFNAYFKEERRQISICLGTGAALSTFNNKLMSAHEVPR